MSSENMESACFAVDAKWTWRDRLRSRLFPSKHCFAPESPEHFKDCVTSRVVTSFSWLDRIRILWTGIVVTHIRTVTEYEVGETITDAVCYAGTAKDIIRE